MDLQKELRATESLTRLIKSAEECRTLHDEAGMEYPPALKRILGLGDRAPTVFIAPPNVPGRPPSVPASWVPVPVKEMTPTGIVLAVLAAAKEPMPVKDVVSAVEKVLGSVNRGSIHNIGTRLGNDKVIDRPDAGWVLNDKGKGLALHESHVWGPVDAFEKTELAAWRRQAILHVLRAVKGGLQQSQIVSHLESCEWLRVPVNIDVVKLDMLELQKLKKVKRVRNKWVLSTGEDA